MSAYNTTELTRHRDSIKRNSYHLITTTSLMLSNRSSNNTNQFQSYKESTSLTLIKVINSILAVNKSITKSHSISKDHISNQQCSVKNELFITETPLKTMKTAKIINQRSSTIEITTMTIFSRKTLLPSSRSNNF